MGKFLGDPFPETPPPSPHGESSPDPPANMAEGRFAGGKRGVGEMSCPQRAPRRVRERTRGSCGVKRGRVPFSHHLTFTWTAEREWPCFRSTEEAKGSQPLWEGDPVHRPPGRSASRVQAGQDLTYTDGLGRPRSCPPRLLRLMVGTAGPRLLLRTQPFQAEEPEPVPQAQSFRSHLRGPEVSDAAWSPPPRLCGRREGAHAPTGARWAGAGRRRRPLTEPLLAGCVLQPRLARPLWADDALSPGLGAQRGPRPRRPRSASQAFLPPLMVGKVLLAPLGTVYPECRSKVSQVALAARGERGLGRRGQGCRMCFLRGSLFCPLRRQTGQAGNAGPSRRRRGAPQGPRRSRAGVTAGPAPQSSPAEELRPARGSSRRARGATAAALPSRPRWPSHRSAPRREPQGAPGARPTRSPAVSGSARLAPRPSSAVAQAGARPGRSCRREALAPCPRRPPPQGQSATSDSPRACLWPLASL